MTEAKRDLDYYMAHPEEMPTDFESLVDQSGEESGETLEAAIDKKEGAPVEPVAETKEAPVVEKVVEKAEQKEAPQVVKSRDGKHDIPYSVLESERAARKQADLAVAQLQAQIDALKTGASKGEPAEAKESDLSAEEIEQVAEDFPAVAKLLKGLSAQVGALQGQLTEVRASEHARRGQEQTSASTTVQQAIDANPVLSYWQSKDQNSFALAVQFDNQIKADSRNANLSLDERFGKVVKAMEAVYGETELPDDFKAKVAAPAAKAAQKQDKASAEKAIAAAEKAEPKIASLSDIPGGVPPEVDDVAQLGTLTSHELGNKFLKMTAEQQNAILARLA